MAACTDAFAIFRAIASTLLRGGDHLTAAQFRRLREIFDAGEDDPDDPLDPSLDPGGFAGGLTGFFLVFITFIVSVFILSESLSECNPAQQISFLVI